MDEIRVDFRALEDAENNLRMAVDQIDQHLTELEGYVEQLLANWTGEAAEAYRHTQHEWDHAVAAMREEVREMHTLIVTAHGNHAGAVRASTKIWEL